MKTITLKTITLLVTTLLLPAVIFFSRPVCAHYASVTMDNYHPAAGDAVTVDIGFGHKFPAEGEMRKAAYQHTTLAVIDREGNTRELTVTPRKERGNEPVKVTFDEKGVYTILLSKKNFSSKTTKGYKYQPRNALDGVIHSKWSETVSKALVNVGGVDSVYTAAATGERFRIVPLENPFNLEKGQTLPVKVTFDGDPWRGMIYATYENFSDKKDTFAFTTKTDKKGLAHIKLLQKGKWLIKADHAYPYEDKEKADNYSFTTTLTFDL